METISESTNMLQGLSRDLGSAGFDGRRRITEYLECQR
jgi:hypothetical protein